MLVLHHSRSSIYRPVHSDFQTSTTIDISVSSLVAEVRCTSEKLPEYTVTSETVSVNGHASGSPLFLLILR